MTERDSLRIAVLSERYAADPREPERVLREVSRRVHEAAEGIFIHRVPADAVLAQLEHAQRLRQAGASLPLFGIPFAVKDNIDVAGMSTTAACPAYAYLPTRSAAVVERLAAAGAIVIGKTNLDQFATGLSGTRSPYGIPRNPFDARFISGGSSSGSAVAVATGLASFALGTDTAGSGRVPAAFTNIVGFKPTRGRWSLRGVVPACRSLDCVSVFAMSAGDAERVAGVCSGFDPEDPLARAAALEPRRLPVTPRIGVPRAEQLEFFGDVEAARLYEGAVRSCERLGATRVTIDLAPFLEAATLLYGGPWLAERLVAAGALLASNPDAIHPVVRSILETADRHSALEAFRAQYTLAELRRAAEREWTRMDALLLPTTPTVYTIEQMLEEPVTRNAHLGRYTNFVNLLDLCAVAVPAGFRSDGLPLGVTLIAPADSDDALLRYAARLHAASGASTGEVLLAVAGAHLSGEPLNGELTSRGARLVRRCRTAPEYRMYALATRPPKPGLARDPGFRGRGLEVEIWALDDGAFGSFVSGVPAPLVIGTLLLEDGTSVKGFLCEGHALQTAEEITRYGGWRAYLERR